MPAVIKRQAEISGFSEHLFEKYKNGDNYSDNAVNSEKPSDKAENKADKGDFAENTQQKSADRSRDCVNYYSNDKSDEVI